ncbi:hypothetical protein [Halonatronum saccharophilum]|uniref:hypothetical protein n=1 Tax=Halonatronum saccharophilum TaxID=150060 RepID=UPI00048274AA|nr:hypothetical protein [Halonatronum saccharophilum]
MSKEKIFIPDTNVLLFLTSFYLDDAPDNWQNAKAKKFYNKAKDRIYILDLVWAEFLGIFLHKSINFSRYDLWYRNRRSLIEKLFSEFIREGVNYISINDGDSYKDLFEISRSFTNGLHIKGIAKKINEDSVSKLQKKIKKAKRWGDRNKVWSLQDTVKRIKSDGKIFDGIDSALAVYAYLVSKDNPKKEVILVTADKSLEVGINYCNKIEYSFAKEEKWDIKAVGLYNAIEYC